MCLFDQHHALWKRGTIVRPCSTSPRTSRKRGAVVSYFSSNFGRRDTVIWFPCCFNKGQVELAKLSSRASFALTETGGRLAALAEDRARYSEYAALSRVGVPAVAALVHELARDFPGIEGDDFAYAGGSLVGGGAPRTFAIASGPAFHPRVAPSAAANACYRNLRGRGAPPTITLKRIGRESGRRGIQ
jgi:hypothetical protein